jgi:hypothetical protein
MSEKRARYVGDPDGCDITIPLANGETRNRHIPHGGEIPIEIDGARVPAAFRDSLLDQPSNWTLVNRATGDDARKATP